LKSVFICVSIIAAAWATAGCATATQTVAPNDVPANGAEPVFRTLQVAPARVDCVGVAPTSCLQVREAADAPWTQLFGEISGFTYEPGYLYEIRIREDAVAHPPADGSSVRRTLVAVLSRTPAAPPLVGPTWRLVSLRGRDVVPGTRVTAVFAADDRVSGSAGCNRYFGSSAVGAGSLEMGAIGSTRMACGAEGVMAQEDAYLDALGGAKAFRIQGAELRLGPAPGAVTLVFRSE
jgi:heat shock protein HslJ